MQQTMTTDTQQTARFDLPGYVLITVLVGTIFTGLAASSAPLWLGLVAAGFVLAAAQWWAVGDAFQRGAAWWIGLTGAGWIGGMLAGYVGMFGVGILDTPAPNLFAMAVYVPVFLILGGFQWFALRRESPQAGWWLLISALGGLVIGALSVGACLGTGAQPFTTYIGGSGIEDGTVPRFCVNIGLTLPRLQSAEPWFNFIPRTYLSHLAGWLGYALVSGFGLRWLLRR